MTEKMLKVFMAVTKQADGSLVGILSDTSMDRDEEFMSKELLQSWAQNKTLKALAQHENKMQSWVGGWQDLRTVEKDGNTALIAKPWFFSKEANPLAEQIKNQVEEALAKGENAGISIGAIPKETIEKEVDGIKRTVFTKAELVEATWVPIQSNRNSFAEIAKQFNFNAKAGGKTMTVDKGRHGGTAVDEEDILDKPSHTPDERFNKPADVDACVRSLMADPNFQPEGGRSKEESAHAICQARMKEVNTMTEKKYTQKDMDEALAKVKKEAEEQKPTEPAAPAAAPAEKKNDEGADAGKADEENKKAIAELQKELKKLNDLAVLKATVEGPGAAAAKQDENITVERMLKARYGIKQE